MGKRIKPNYSSPVVNICVRSFADSARKVTAIMLKTVLIFCLAVAVSESVAIKEDEVIKEDQQSKKDALEQIREYPLEDGKLEHVKEDDLAKKGLYKEDQLVTMPKHELFAIVHCVAKWRHIGAHEKFKECEKLMPLQVTEALDECQKEVIPEDMKKCSYYSVLFEKPGVVPEIYDCIRKRTSKFTPEEKKKVVEFEECSRKLFVKTCPVSSSLKFF